MTNVLLIHPEFPDSYWTHSHAMQILGRKSLTVPLGLLTVAAMLPEQWGKRLVDLNVRPLTDDDLAWASCVFVTGMAIQRDTARNVIARCKAAGKTVVAGGPLFANEYALYEQVDHFILSEAELTLGQFIADYEAGCAKRTYRNRGEFADLTTSPIPLWHLAEFDKYESMGIQFSRGCPFDCEFCNVTALFGRKPRVKSAAQVIAELDALYDAGWRRSVFFVDDNLIGNRAAARNELLPALIDWQKRRGPLTFLTQVSIDLASDDALLRQMVDAGFQIVFVGIETPNPDSLAECHKRQNEGRDLLADVKKLQRAGLQVQGGFIVGFDNDTPAIFQSVVNFIQESGIVTAMVGMLQAPPGTRLFKRMQAEGRLLGHSTGDNTDGSTNIVPRMGIEKLLEGYRYVMQQIYSPAALYQRLRTFLSDSPARPGRPWLTLGRLRRFAKATAHLCISGGEWQHYLPFLGWTLLHNPRMLPEAVRLAVFGHHYRAITEHRLVASSDPAAPAGGTPASTPNATAAV